MNTLMVHTGGIGDFILSCPALEHLAQTGPVDLLGNPERLRLAVAAGLARKAYNLDSVDFGSVFGESSRRLRAFLADYDRVLVWMRDEDGRIASAIRGCGVASVACFPGLPPEEWAQHASAYYLHCLGLPPCDRVRLNIPADVVQNALVIHPGSGGKKKNWPLEQYYRLTEQLQDQGYKVVWLLGPAEEGMTCPEGVIMVQENDLPAIAKRLAGARGYIGNDSGITHLAAAVGCPVVAVFGPTNPCVWGPLAPQAHLLQGNPWPDLETVLDAAKRSSLNLDIPGNSARS